MILWHLVMFVVSLFLTSNSQSEFKFYVKKKKLKKRSTKIKSVLHLQSKLFWQNNFPSQNRNKVNMFYNIHILLYLLNCNICIFYRSEVILSCDCDLFWIIMSSETFLLHFYLRFWAIRSLSLTQFSFPYLLADLGAGSPNPGAGSPVGRAAASAHQASSFPPEGTDLPGSD